MKFKVDELDVYFPYPYIYPEQYQYMVELKRALDAHGHCVLEMPTGTGKTVTLLSLITSYQLAHPDTGKLVYCTRTVPEMEKALEELKIVLDYREKEAGPVAANYWAVGLSSRRNLCVHPRVSAAGDRPEVDANCRKLTASWVRADAESNSEIELCDFFEKFYKEGNESRLPYGVYTLEDLKQEGKDRGWCPYFLARHMISICSVVVYNYSYVLDPKISNLVSRELEKECIIVFDEAHNIDNVCIESLSVNINQSTLDSGMRNVRKLSDILTRIKATDAQRLNDEYQRLVRGLAETAQLGGEIVHATPLLPQDVLDEAMPGNIRRAEHFIRFMQRLVDYLKTRMQVQKVTQETPLQFLHSLYKAVEIEAKPLKFAAERLNSLMRTLEIADVDEFTPLTLISDFATLLSTYTSGFTIIFEPYEDRLPNVPNPVLQLSCMDASIAVKPVFERFQSVVITSGTLSPIELYPKMLNFKPITIQSYSISLDRNCICPMVIGRGSDQLPISSQFDMRQDTGVIRNYGKLLQEMCSVIPDGVVGFFPSYAYMEEIVHCWDEMGMLKQIMELKLVFIETPDYVETSLALENFRKACDCGRGAVFLSVARGKVSEGIDFDRHYGRAVILFGIPYQYTLSRILQARMEFLRDNFQIKESEFLTFDAIRQAAQCVGRVIRSKKDYGLMIFADKRYNRADKRGKLPRWINDFLGQGHVNLSTDTALAMAKEFLKKMSQPQPKDVSLGNSLWSYNDIEAFVKGKKKKPRIN